MSCQNDEYGWTSVGLEFRGTLVDRDIPKIKVWLGSTFFAMVFMTGNIDLMADPSQTQEHRVGKTQLAHGIPTCSDQTSSQSCISLRYIPDTMAQ